jgi:hypothetical protein
MDNAACQACHQQRYESFATDHPNFGQWPFERRSRIAFNHATHSTKHFVEKKATFDCRNCHVEDAAGDVQLTLSFEAACASCHLEKIATSVARGIPMFALPTLDVDALREAGYDIGPWPEKASGDFDGKLPPVMKVLLASDPVAAQAMAQLGDDCDFFEVDPNDPEQLAACATLARAIRQLMLDLGTPGIDSVGERLTAALSGVVTQSECAALAAGLSADTLRGAAAWLSHVDADESASVDEELGGALPPRRGVSMIENGDNMPAPLSGEGMPNAPATSTNFEPAGTWFCDDATLSIRYRPASHADPVLASWLSLLAPTGLSTQPIRHATFNELADPTAPGLCTSCHSVEQMRGHALTVNWRSYDRRSELRSFTKFSHGPHLVLPQLADCTSCHTINRAAQPADSYADLDPHQFTSEFEPLSKQQCAECHTTTAAGDRCQSCHNYHVTIDALGARLRQDPSHPKNIRQPARTSSGTRPGRR